MAAAPCIARMSLQGPRSLARVDAILMFILFGVYFAWVGQATGSMAFGVFMAVLFAQALGCIINIAAQLEDPFNAGTANDQVTAGSMS